MKLRAVDITWREIDGDLVVLDLRSSQYLTANASGAVLLRRLTEERTVAELVSALVDAFDVPEPAAREDVRRFVDELDRRGLLERAEARLPVDPIAAHAGESTTGRG